MIQKITFGTIFLLLSTVIFAQKKNAEPAKKMQDPIIANTQINWVSVNDLPALLQKQPKKIFIDVYTSWCGPCKMMMTNTFGDANIIKYVNDNFYAVKFNAEGNELITFKGYEFKNSKFDPAKTAGRNGTHDFAMAIASVQTRLAYPTIVFLDENLNILSPLQGYYQANQMQAVLSYFKEDKFKQIDLNTYLQEVLKP